MRQNSTYNSLPHPIYGKNPPAKLEEARGVATAKSAGDVTAVVAVAPSSPLALEERKYNLAEAGIKKIIVEPEIEIPIEIRNKYGQDILYIEEKQAVAIIEADIFGGGDSYILKDLKYKVINIINDEIMIEGKIDYVNGKLKTGNTAYIKLVTENGKTLIDIYEKSSLAKIDLGI